MADQLEQIREHAQAFLEPGEETLAAMSASPRGRNTAMAAGGAGSMIGYKMVSGQVKKAEQLGLKVESNMLVVLTDQRLLTMKVKYSMGGTITAFNEVLSAIPLSQIESIEAKRAGLAGVLIITGHGSEPFKLECQVGRARKLVDAFDRVNARV